MSCSISLDTPVYILVNIDILNASCFFYDFLLRRIDSNDMAFPDL